VTALCAKTSKKIPRKKKEKEISRKSHWKDHRREEDGSDSKDRRHYQERFDGIRKR